jgi:membrane fusion protein, multidrug efflux system
MRWYGQLAVIAVLGGGAYFGAQHWSTLQTYIPKPILDVIQPLLPRTAAAPQGAPSAGGPPAGGAPRPPGQGGGPPPPVVEVLPVTTGVVTEVAEAVGTTRAFESIVLNSKVSGIVESISFQEGAKVAQGEELLKLDSAERRADVESSRAAIQQEEARRAELRTRLERAVALRRSGAGTEALVDDLTAQIRTADSAVQAAIARERAAQARMNDMIIRAPFTGRVGIRQVSVGSFLENRTTITTLDDISKIRLDFQVPETLVGRLEVDAPITASGPAFGARRFSGQVRVVDTRVDPVTRSVRLTAVIENPDENLKPGMFLNVNLKVAVRGEAMLIPEEAIVGEGPLQIAFVVKDNRIERRLLTIGQRQDGKVEVSRGLAVGEQLVVRGVQRVRQGLVVTPRPFGAPPPAPAGTPAGAPAAPSAGAPPAAQRPQAQGGGGPSLASPAQAAAPAPAQTQTR